MPVAAPCRLGPRPAHFNASGEAALETRAPLLIKRNSIIKTLANCQGH